MLYASSYQTLLLNIFRVKLLLDFLLMLQVKLPVADTES